MPTMGGASVNLNYRIIKIKVTLHDIGLFFVIFSRLNNALYESDIFFLAAILISSIGILSRLKKLLAQPKRYIVWLSLFLTIYISSMMWAENPTRTWNNFIATAGRAIILLYIYTSITNKDELIRVISVFTMAVIANDIFIFIVYGPSVLIQARIDDQVSAAGNSNTIGMSSAFAFILTVFKTRLYLTEKNKPRIIQYAILLGFILLSGSKKALLIIVFALGFYYILSHRNKLANIIIIGLVVILGYELLINVPALYLMVGNRVESLINGMFSIFDLGKLTTSNLIQTSLNSSDRVRMNFVLYGIQWIREKPVIGHGMANFIDLYGRMYTKSYYAHNNYIEIGVGLGAVGIITYYWIYLYMLRKSLRIIKEYACAKVALAIIILAIILDFGLVSYLVLEFQFYFMVGFILISSPDLYEESRRNENNQMG